jgi:Alpha/beta hydrolase family
VATYSLVHGAWHGGWAWDLVRAELEARGHTVHAPDLPCEEVGLSAEDYAAVVPPADVVVGHSMAGYVIPHVDAGRRVYLCALHGPRESDTFVPGFGDARISDELGRSYYPVPADGARELQYPVEYAQLAAKLRRQAPLAMSASNSLSPADPLYVVCARDACISPAWQRRAPMPQVEIDAGHSPMLECPERLVELLEGEAGVV